MRLDKTLVCLLAWALLFVAAHAAPQKATFASDVSTTQWPLADLDPQLPLDWTDAEFLVVEFRSSTSQRFELGLVSDEGNVSKRIHPFANVWVRASIPLRFFRQGLGDADELASTVNQPRNSYWINIEAGGHAPVRHVRALSVTMRYPARASTVEIRKVSLSKTDPGDAVLDGGAPLIDDFGQYVHADWPGKARSFACAQARMGPGRPHAGAQGRHPGLPLRRLRSRPSQGHGLLSRREDRRSLVVHRSGGLPLLLDGRERRGRGTAAHSDRRPRRSCSPAFRRPPRFPAPNAEPDPLRDPVSFYAANLRQRFGSDWRTPSAQLTSRRMRAWGLNTAYGAALNDALPAGSSLRQPYVFPLRGWQQIEGAIMGLPDVYSEAFARRVDAEAAQQLGPRKTDPWMIGYFIGNEPPWPARESQLVDLVLAGPASSMQQRFKSELAKGDTPAARKALVHAAFTRYLEIVNAAVKRARP